MIEIKSLKKNYGNFPALKGIDFSVSKGEIVGLLGPNGAGKSTAIRILCGYLSATSGSVKVFDQVIEPGMVNVSIKRRIGYLPESAPLYKDMIVYDYLTYSHLLKTGKKSSANPLDVKNALKAVIEQCGLTSVIYKNINELSKGFRQRVGLASALTGNPEILVLDEPTSGLDPNQIIEIRNLIKEVGKEKTVLLCSHILPEVEATCGRVVILKEGRIIADSNTDQLKSHMGMKHQLTLGVKGVLEQEVMQKLSALDDLEVKPHQLKGEEATGAQGFLINYRREKDRREDVYRVVVENNWPLLVFHQTSQSLEEIFRELTHQDQGTEQLVDARDNSKGDVHE